MNATGRPEPGAVAVAALWLALGCQPNSRHGPTSARDGEPASGVESGDLGVVPSVRASAPPPVPPAPPQPPELLGKPLQALPVEGFGSATIALPLGTRGPRPVIIALHGNYDRPEWQCEVWRDISESFPWVLCPRGVPRTDAPKSADRWTYAGWPKLRDEIEAGLEALAAAHPTYVDTEAPIFTGFSLGAILGVHLLTSTATEGQKLLPAYRAAVLIEGGYTGWHLNAAKTFSARGGQRVLFACGQSTCRQASKQAARMLEKHGVSAEIVSGGDIGHTYSDAVADAVRSRWGWLTQVDSRFRKELTEARGLHSAE